LTVQCRLDIPAAPSKSEGDEKKSLIQSRFLTCRPSPHQHRYFSQPGRLSTLSSFLPLCAITPCLQFVSTFGVVCGSAVSSGEWVTRLFQVLAYNRGRVQSPHPNFFPIRRFFPLKSHCSFYRLKIFKATRTVIAKYFLMHSPYVSTSSASFSSSAPRGGGVPYAGAPLGSPHRGPRAPSRPALASRRAVALGWITSL